MKLGDSQVYLVLHASPDDKFSPGLEVKKEISSVFSKWTAQTRLSPIFPVKEIGIKSPKSCTFKGIWFVVFLGPVDPSLLPRPESNTLHLWLGLGLLNIVAASKNNKDINTLTKWATHLGIPFEKWNVTNGKRTKWTSSCKAPRSGNDWSQQLVKVWGSGIKEVKEAIQDTAR